MMAFADQEPAPRMPALNLAAVRVSYDAEGDTLQLKFSPPRPALTIDWQGGLSLRVNPETGDVYGVEIEDFSTHYLRLHPDVAAKWDALTGNALDAVPENLRVRFVKQVLREGGLWLAQRTAATG